MVNNHSPFRQASIRKISGLLLLLAGCQTTAPQKPIVPVASGNPPHAAFLAPAKKPLPTAPISPIPTPPSTPVSETALTPPPQPVVHREPDVIRKRPALPDTVGDWRIEPVSNHEWRVAPNYRRGLSDSPPSLMEDAIIASGIHAKLQHLPGPWKYSSNAGKVVLSTPTLTTDQALAAIRAVAALDKVAEIRLTTSLK